MVKGLGVADGALGAVFGRGLGHSVIFASAACASFSASFAYLRSSATSFASDFSAFVAHVFAATVAVSFASLPITCTSA